MCRVFFLRGGIPADAGHSILSDECRARVTLPRSSQHSKDRFRLPRGRALLEISNTKSDGKIKI
jgi:hypothetical protein